MNKKLRAIGEKIVVKEVENYEDSKVIHVDLTDKKSLRGEVLSVGERVEHVRTGDVITFTDAVQKITDIYEFPVYLMEEDAVFCTSV